ncbi:hypothetical protein B0A49_05854 [Cryomyces minteri]|uniref:Uncharacterized protein n=1 Tax=Cryomyces minteri TaxID=331657 RepID=A0A4U0X2V5_9PEZI|nr:hypothetical protein B0A49_05854 [Cryomyces minteri]
MATDSKKRKNIAVTVDGAPYNKRQRPDHFSTNGRLSNSHSDVDDRATVRATQHSNNKISGGPRGILPVLDDYDEEDGVDDEETYEAMRYLTSVRNEAYGRDLLVLPDDEPSIKIYGSSDSRGYYENGAYVVAPQFGPFLPHPDPGSSNPTSNGSDDRTVPGSPQSAYRARLLERFLVHRTRLRSAPPPHAIAALDRQHPISLPANSRPAFQEWKRLLRTTIPQPAQLASMDVGTVLRLLKLSTNLLRRRQNVDRAVGAWIWGLLGRLGDVGWLSSDDVGVIRDLGKRAVWIGLGFRDGAVADQTEQFDEQEGDGGDEVEYEEDEGEGIGEALGDGEEDMMPGEVQADAIDGPDQSLGENLTLSKSQAASAARPVSGPHDLTDPASTVADEASLFVLEQQTTTPSAHIPPTATVTPSPADTPSTPALEAAKARLMARFATTSTPLSALLDEHSSDDTAEITVRDKASSSADDHGDNAGEDEAASALPNQSTRATLDIVLTIAGEFFGQRDLLEFREEWVGVGAGRGSVEG